MLSFSLPFSISRFSLPHCFCFLPTPSLSSPSFCSFLSSPHYFPILLFFIGSLHSNSFPSSSSSFFYLSLWLVPNPSQLPCRFSIPHSPSLFPPSFFSRRSPLFLISPPCPLFPSALPDSFPAPERPPLVCLTCTFHSALVFNALSLLRMNRIALQNCKLTVLISLICHFNSNSCHVFPQTFLQIFTSFSFGLCHFQIELCADNIYIFVCFLTGILSSIPYFLPRHLFSLHSKHPPRFSSAARTQSPKCRNQLRVSAVAAALSRR